MTATGTRAPAVALPTEPKRRGRMRLAGTRLAFVLPATLLASALLAWPFFESLRVSFFEWPGFGDKEFVGVDNYQELASDGVARTAIKNTIVYATLTAIGTVVIGFVIASLIDRKIRGAKIVKFIVFLPVLLPTVFTSQVWLFGLDGNFGWVNHVLGTVHAGLERAWLGDPSLVNYVIILVSILQFTGFPMVILYAALQDVPLEIHEAATLDGVGPFQRLRYVMFPMIREAVSTVFIIQLMFGFRVFDQVFVMTGGGPGTASEVAATFVWREAFVNAKFGYAAATAIVTTAVVALFSMLYLTIVRPRRIERVG